LIKIAKRFSEAWQQEEVLRKIGNVIFVKLYGGKDSDSLGSLRLVGSVEFSKSLLEKPVLSYDNDISRN